jgi:creatinine amidohydrolase/Fe(II)-dependent formamide hydrolase-like protein
MSAEFGVSPEESGAHAGENEASITMALEPSLVHPDRFVPGYLGLTAEAEMAVIFEKGMTALTSNGILGDPRKASAAQGEVYLERLVDFLVAAIGRKTKE